MEDATQADVVQPVDSGPVPVPTAVDLSGQVLGDFQILHRLGQGGMGQVYLAEQISLKRKVALKILRADLARDAAALQRFQVEATVVASATHANIVQVYAVGNCNGVNFMALEYVEGRNLREYLARKGPPELPLALSIMRQVASALQRASELGIIHRDIKPENILLTRKGEVKVADFGLSRCLGDNQKPLNLTQSGVTMGTPLYMSPEQVQGQPIDPRTDLYSFGVTCYHMLAGQPPFRGGSAYEVAFKHVHAAPEPLSSVRPDLPAQLCAVVHKMMAKEPGQRYQTCSELLVDLAAVQSGVPGAVNTLEMPALSSSTEGLLTPTVAEGVTVRKRRRYASAIAVIVSLAGAAAAGSALSWFVRRPHEPRVSSPAPSAAEVQAVEAMFSLQKREQALLAAVQLYAEPGGDAAKVPLGLGNSIQLGLFYLEQWRLNDAERFFLRLEQSQVKPYQNLGRLGQAMVLAFRNKAAESNRLFLQVVQRDKGARAEFNLHNNAELKPMIARALDYNAANATPQEPFPVELEPLRQPPHAK